METYRPETETYTSHLARLLLEGKLHKDLNPERFGPVAAERKTRPEPLKILDLCSGSGCISLLLYSLLSEKIPNIKIRGYDISEKALKLSKENLRNAERDHFHKPCPVEFRHQDIFGPDDALQMAPQSKSVDIIISNPPYIDPYHFNTTTSRSVRTFEPRLALVPRDMAATAVYRRLIRIHEHLGSRVLVMETSGRQQCLDIASMAREMCGKTHAVRLWKDWLGDDPARDTRGLNQQFGKDRYRTSGSGKLRTVVLIRRSDAPPGGPDA
jgi:HemK-like putative methylase